MNIFRRAYLSVSRRKAKSLILLIVIFILGNVIAGAYSIYRSTQNVEKQIKARLGSTSTIVYDDEKIGEWYEEHPDEVLDLKPLGLATIAEIGALPYVRYYDYELNTDLRSKSFQSLNLGEGDYNIKQASPYEEYPSYFQMRGVYYPNLRDIDDHKIELTQGKVFSQEDITGESFKIIISEELARLNGVSIGDKIAFVQVFDKWDEVSGEVTVVSEKPYEFEITGLFKPLVYEASEDNGDNNNGIPNDNDYKRNDLLNRMYIPAGTAANIMISYYEGLLETDLIKEEDFNGMTIKEIVYAGVMPFYVLNSTDDVNDFREEAGTLLPDMYKVLVSSDSYDNIAGSMKSMQNMAQLTLFIAIIASILILSLVILLFLRDRKHELGIYLALGERKPRIFSQIILEVILVAIVGMGLSVFSGNLIASSLSESVLAAQQSEPDIWLRDSFYYDPFDSGVTQEDVNAAYEVKLSLGYIATFMAVGLGVSILSTAAPMLYIIRLEPKKIMM